MKQVVELHSIMETLIAFLENNYQEDRSIYIPKVLRFYLGGKETIVPKK